MAVSQCFIAHDMHACVVSDTAVIFHAHDLGCDNSEISMHFTDSHCDHCYRSYRMQRSTQGQRSLPGSWRTWRKRMSVYAGCALCSQTTLTMS
jgi:hypothetical protein